MVGGGAYGDKRQHCPYVQFYALFRVRCYLCLSGCRRRYDVSDNSSSAQNNSSTATVNTAVTVPSNGILLVAADAYNFGAGPTFSSWTNATNDSGTSWSNTNSSVHGVMEVGHSSVAGSINARATYSGAADLIKISAIAIQASAVVPDPVNIMFTQQLRW